MGAQLYWERHGSGEPLLWITGFTISSEVFRPILPLYDRHFDCVLYDNRGAGRSRSVPGLTSMPQLAADAAGDLAAGGLAAAAAFLLTRGGSFFLDRGDTWRSLALGIGSMALWTMIGMGIGILIRNLLVAMLVTSLRKVMSFKS